MFLAKLKQAIDTDFESRVIKHTPAKRKAYELDVTVTNMLRVATKHLKSYPTFMAHVDDWTKQLDKMAYSDLLQSFCLIQKAIAHINVTYEQFHPLVMSALPVYFIRDCTRNCNSGKLNVALRELILTNAAFLTDYCKTLLVNEKKYGLELPANDYSVPHYERDVELGFEYIRFINHVPSEDDYIQNAIDAALPILPHFRIICDISDNKITREIFMKYGIREDIADIMGAN